MNTKTIGRIIGLYLLGLGVGLAVCYVALNNIDYFGSNVYHSDRLLRFTAAMVALIPSVHVFKSLRGDRLSRLLLAAGSFVAMFLIANLVFIFFINPLI
jgi:hypothetical protein